MGKEKSQGEKKQNELKIRTQALGNTGSERGQGKWKLTEESERRTLW